MKKLFMLLVIMLLMCMAIPVLASEDDGVMVYAPAEERDKVYEMLFDEKSDMKYTLDTQQFQIVKESISYVYEYDKMEFYRSGKLVLKKVDGLYGSKMIRKSDGKFAGNMHIDTLSYGFAARKMEEPSLNWRGFWRVNSNDFPDASLTYYSSCNYADHAENIRILLGKDELISPYNVKLVRLDGGVGVFYIQIDDEEYFIPYGSISIPVEEQYKENIDVGDGLSLLSKERIINAMNEWADRVRAKEIEIELWKKAHPGEKYNLIGGDIGGANVAFSNPYGHFDNIIDNMAYFGIDEAAIARKVTKRKMIPIIFTVGAGVIVIGVLGGVLMARRKRKLAQ